MIDSRTVLPQPLSRHRYRRMRFERVLAPRSIPGSQTPVGGVGCTFSRSLERGQLMRRLIEAMQFGKIAHELLAEHRPQPGAVGCAQS